MWVEQVRWVVPAREWHGTWSLLIQQMALAHHTLIAWQRADRLFLELHQLSSKAFPASERYELGAQLRRAAFSVARHEASGT